jgi:hypothetical protein
MYGGEYPFRGAYACLPSTRKLTNIADATRGSINVREVILNGHTLTAFSTLLTGRLLYDRRLQPAWKHLGRLLYLLQ